MCHSDRPACSRPGFRRVLSSCLLSFALLSAHAAAGQASDTWFAFTEGEADEMSIGYRDAEGKVRIAPRFSSYITAKKFDDIIAVMEAENGEWKWKESYYLTKTGRRVGQGDMYTFDNAFDCENEGFIRFTRNGKTGLFDANGDIAIPAEYDSLSRAMNGRVLGLKNAQKHYQGEHYGWKGGEGVLLTTENKILIEPFDFFDDSLYFYEVVTSDRPIADPLRKQFRGVDGKFHAFIHLETEFRAWLKTALPDDFKKADLLRVTHESVAALTEGETENAVSKAQFVDKYYAAIHSKLASLEEAKYFIMRRRFSPDLPEERYFNNCREVKLWQYPILSIVIPRADSGQDTYFEFMRTEQGYILIDLQISG
ncbi:MAG: WG repeat-containing protein [Zoogloeaceae bacterium]|nr:WG repeat-containing protein [Zoogloeaceae bacterium]